MILLLRVDWNLGRLRIIYAYTEYTELLARISLFISNILYKLYCFSSELLPFVTYTFQTLLL